MDVIIYHNPDCGTSRNTLAMIRQLPAIEPTVIEYLQDPPEPERWLEVLIAAAGSDAARGAARRRARPTPNSASHDPDSTDDQLARRHDRASRS